MIFIISVAITIMFFVGCFCVKKQAIRSLFVIIGLFCGLIATLIGNFTYTADSMTIILIISLAASVSCVVTFNFTTHMRLLLTGR